MDKTITIQGFVRFDADEAAAGTHQPYRWVKGEPHWYGDEYVRTCVAIAPITFSVPDGFDPRAEQIAILEQQREELRAKFQLAETEIRARISKLQAITYEPEVA